MRPIVALLVIGSAGMALAIAASQRDPGPGVWDLADPKAFEGVVTAEPYAMLRVAGPSADEPVRTLLLVSQGKFGAAERVASYDGQAVRVTGTLLHREGRWMLELADGDEAIRPAVLPADREAALRWPVPAPAGRVTLRGEMIDPKCYIGAMKPGGGKTHKACAQLCVGGGIPPMFVVRDVAGGETFYLVTTSQGGPATELVLPYLGDPVEITGDRVRRGDLQEIRLDAEDVRRL